jgi:major vault protein
MAIEGEASVRQAQLAAEAEKIKVQSDLAQKVEKQKAHVAHQTALNKLEIQKAKDLAAIEADKFKGIIDAVGSDIISAIATAGPAAQADLLSSLQLSSFMVTDGNTPINLFNTAAGLIGGSHI